MSKQSRFHAGVTKSVQSLNLVADVLRLVLFIFVYFLYFCVSWLWKPFQHIPNVECWDCQPSLFKWLSSLQVAKFSPSLRKKILVSELDQKTEDRYSAQLLHSHYPSTDLMNCFTLHGSLDWKTDRFFFWLVRLTLPRDTYPCRRRLIPDGSND